jgi:5-methylthioribose kinase
MALETPPGYRPLRDVDVATYLAGISSVADRLGGATSTWRVREVGDGNLNLVFIVEGERGGVVVKQALPYVRLVGESWPLSIRRSFFEARALAAEFAAAPEHVPEVFHVDDTLALIAMGYLTPHVILRKGLIRGVVYPHLADHMASFLARTLFATSDLGQPAAAKKPHVAMFCANAELCRITEDLVFTDPWRESPNNRWTTPQLDDTAAAVRRDAAWQRAAQELKLAFMTEAQALIHGDLHSGSIMVTTDDTRVIDPEFAFYGPMGFDIGALIGNLYLALFSQRGHTSRDDYRAWIVETAEQVWIRFSDRFVALWTHSHAGDALAPAGFADPGELRDAQATYMRRLFVASLGFAGAKMTRRILGLAHVEDFESIADADLRASCERRALRLARSLMVEPARFTDIAAVSAAARDIEAA